MKHQVVARHQEGRKACQTSCTPPAATRGSPSACWRPSVRTKLAVEAITKSAETMSSAIPDGGKASSSMPPAGHLGDVVREVRTDVKRA